MIPVWVYPLLAVLVVAIGWRVSARFRIRRRLSAALRSPREMDRRAGARECVAVGVTETARMLVRLVRREQSRAVLDELVIALAERQWEPASKAAMVDLRLWARGYALEHPEVLAVASHDRAKLEEPAEPGEPAPAQTQPAPAGPALAAGQADEAAAARAAAPPGRPRSAVAEVSPTTVLVTGAGSAAAIATIRELHRLGHRVLATDRDPLSAGLRLADVAEVVPPADQPGFAVCLVQAVRRHGAAAMICTAPSEHAAVQAAGDEFTGAGVHWSLPRLDAVRACADKPRLRAALRGNGLPVPEAGLAVLAEAGVRPFTADVLLGPDGQAAGIIMHWRLETANGMSARAETFADHRVRDLCLRTLKVLRLTGPASLLGAVTPQHEPVLLDVHPYFSAQLPLSLRAGADLVGQHLRQVFGLLVLT
ncbi:MAG TPA: hypothetical protein VID31_14295, partial [Streptosporangiaceae bacterium]